MFIEAFKALLRLQIRIQRKFVLAVDIGLLHLRECGVKVHRAEFMNLIIASRCLCAELVARDIQDLESLIMIILVQLFDRRILRGKAAAGRGVYDKDNLAFVFTEVELLALSGGNCVIVDHCLIPPFLF